MANPETDRVPSPLAQIYLDQHDQLYRAAYRVVGNATDAEDVIQSVFLHVTLREHSAQAANNIAGYLYRAAINTALDLLRTRREGQLVPLDMVLPRQADEVSGNDQVLRTRLRDALSRLSPRWAEIFVLKHIEGCDNGEIARLCKWLP